MRQLEFALRKRSSGVLDLLLWHSVQPVHIAFQVHFCAWYKIPIVSEGVELEKFHFNFFKLIQTREKNRNCAVRRRIARATIGVRTSEAKFGSVRFAIMAFCTACTHRVPSTFLCLV